MELQIRWIYSDVLLEGNVFVTHSLYISKEYPCTWITRLIHTQKDNTHKLIYRQIEWIYTNILKESKEIFWSVMCFLSQIHGHVNITLQLTNSVGRKQSIWLPHHSVSLKPLSLIWYSDLILLHPKTYNVELVWGSGCNNYPLYAPGFSFSLVTLGDTISWSSNRVQLKFKCHADPNLNR